MAKLHKIEFLVKQELETNTESKSDDFILILNVLKNYVTTEMSLESIFKNHARLEIPCLESITRCRRKLQELYPELRNEKMQQNREVAKQAYIEYAKEKGFQ